MRVRQPSASLRAVSAEQAVLAGLVLAGLAVRVNVLGHLNVNWDEFYYLSQVFDHDRGGLTLRLQTFHVHFFGWLARVSGNEVDQIVAARAVMLGLQAVACVALYRIARRLTGANAALFAVAAYLAMSCGVRSGASFRSDPLAICLIMCALDLLLAPDRSARRLVTAGLLFATAGMVTIKVAIFLPSVALILIGPHLLRLSDRTSRPALITGLTTVLGFTFLHWVHAATLNQQGVRHSVEVARLSFSKMLAEAHLFPQLEVLTATLRWDMAFWACLLGGCGLVIQRIRHTSGRERLRWVEAAALVLPLGSLALYRNSYPYFYPFLLAPASVVTALAWEALARAAGPGAPRLLLKGLKTIVLTWFVASLMLHGLLLPRVMPLAHQREVVAVIHRMFPAPVPYLDRSSMIGSFPQVGFFMTTWGIESYNRRGQPILQQAIQEKQPPLLIANHPFLDIAGAVYPPGGSIQPGLLESDRKALERAYVHYWGPIYVAGVRLDAEPGATARPFDVALGGRYQLEADGPVQIDGEMLRPGESVSLRVGGHRITEMGTIGSVTLHWASVGERPKAPAPALPVFLGH